jgi:hypothetical protein
MDQSPGLKFIGIVCLIVLFSLVLVPQLYKINPELNIWPWPKRMQPSPIRFGAKPAQEGTSPKEDTSPEINDRELNGWLDYANSACFNGDINRASEGYDKVSEIMAGMAAAGKSWDFSEATKGKIDRLRQCMKTRGLK